MKTMLTMQSIYCGYLYVIVIVSVIYLIILKYHKIEIEIQMCNELISLCLMK